MVHGEQTETIDDLSPELQEILGEFLESYALSVEQGSPLSYQELVQRHPQLRSHIERMATEVEALCKIPSDSSLDRFAPFDATPIGKGMVLGDFEIVRELGRGGMGIVYLAFQKSLQRQVALKVLPFAAVLDPNQIARFHTEAQAAASLHHPHIVPVYSVGCQHGVHYYSMQYIDGQTIESFLQGLKQENILVRPACESTPLAHQSTRRTTKSVNYVRQIIRKMVDVATALSFAHARGIIHRDIKPSNLIIDRQGDLWITDFGLARIQDGQNVTIDGDLVGTLRYMSPEQASGQAHLVDHRVDLYSFGVTLYEMLTLHNAFDGSDRCQVHAAIERASPISARKLNPAIPIDVETIILKCIAPLKDDRYSTANALAEDLQRFLDNKPITARRPSLVDRISKWGIRRKKSAAAIAIGLLILACGSTMTTFFVMEQRNRAQLFAQNAQVVVDRFGSEFADQLEGIPGTEALRRDILRETSQYYTQLIAYTEKEPTLLRQAAQAEHRFACISQRLGKIDAALGAYRNAIEKWRHFSESRGMLARDTIQLAGCYRDLATLLSRLGEDEEARSHFETALLLLGPMSASAESRCELVCERAKTRSEVSIFWAREGRKKDAISLLQQSICELEKALPSCTAEERHDVQFQLALTLNNQASILLDHDAAQASSILQRFEQLMEEPAIAQSPRLSHRMLLAIAASNYGVAERKLGNRDNSAHHFRRGEEVLREILDRYPDYFKAHIELAACYNNWAQLHIDQRLFTDAKENLEEAQSLLLNAQSKFPGQPEIPHFLHRIQQNMGTLLEATAKPDSNHQEAPPPPVTRKDDLVLILKMANQDHLPESSIADQGACS